MKGELKYGLSIFSEGQILIAVFPYGKGDKEMICHFIQWDVTVSHIPESESDHFASSLFLSSTCMLCISERCLGDTALCIKILGWTAQ